MKQVYLLKYILLILFVSGIQTTKGQHEIYKQVKEFRVVYGQSGKSADLFTRQPHSLRSARVIQAVNKSTLLKLNTSELKKLHQSKNAKLELTLPYEKGHLELELIRTELFTPDFKVVTSESNELPVAVQPGIYYRGIAKNDSNTLATISIFENEVLGIIASDQGNIVIGNYDKNKKDEYIIYNDHDLTKPFIFDCQTPEVEHGSQLAEEIRKLAAQKNLESRANRCVRLYLELDYTLVTEKGGRQGAINWITAVYNQIQALYAIDAVSFAISEIYTWTTPDPYDDSTTIDALNRFWDNRPNYNGDLAHLISRGEPSSGGIAAVDGLCNGRGYAYSWVGDSYKSFPTYSWTINVLAHETGHNLGSPHTHSCTWPGGAIDGCGPTYNPDYADDACPIGPIPANGGTIMSYCHLLSTGINLNKGFGPLPANLITNKINAASCLSSSCIINVAIPSNITASDGTFTDKVTITWTGTSGNYFQVYRNTTNSNSAATVLSGWQSSTNYNDFTANANQTYYYWVRAASSSSGANVSGLSGSNSGWRSAITVTVPTSVIATDGTYTDRVAVTWTGTSGNYFQVYRNTTNNSGTATALSSWQTSSSFNDYTATANQTYYYWVRAASNSSGVNVSGFSGTNSGWRSAITVTIPTSVSATDGTYTDRVAVTWTGTSGNYFQVYRNTTNNSSTASALSGWQSSTSYNDFTANANQTYYYWVLAASNSSGANVSSFSASNSGWRSAITVTIPTSVSATDGTYTDRVAVSWAGTSGNYFQVYRNTTNNSSTATLVSSWQTSTSYNDYTVNANQTYYYWVRAASNSSGANVSSFSASNSGWRSAITVTIPTSVSSTDGTYTDRVAVSWTGTSGNYFQVYRNTTNNSGTATILSSWQTSTSYNDYTINANQTYYYWVRAASNSSGANVSSFSASNSGWRSAITVTIPTSVSATDGIYTDRVAVSWVGTSGNYFQVYRNTTNNSSTASALSSWQTITSYNDFTATANQTYYYWVRAASNSSGANLSGFGGSNTGWRSAITVTIPASVSATDGTYSDRVAVTWTGTSGNYFQVYRNTTNNSSTASALSGWQTSASYNDFTATANQTYYYWVRAASNVSGGNLSSYGGPNTGWRNVSSGCATPSGLKATQITPSNCTLTWNPVNGASQYTLWYRNGNTWVQFGTTTQSSVGVGNMSSGSQYCFAIKAVCSSTSSNFTISICITTLAGLQNNSQSNIYQSLPDVINTEHKVAEFSLYPNPVKVSSDFFIKYYSPDQTSARIQLIDVSGKTIDSYDQPINAGENKVKMVAPINGGIYILRVITKNGELSTTKLQVN